MWLAASGSQAKAPLAERFALPRLPSITLVKSRQSNMTETTGHAIVQEGYLRETTTDGATSLLLTRWRIMPSGGLGS